MGVVYAAYDEQLERTVAIKMIHERLAGPVMRDRLLREARAAASVRHPAVCQLYEIGEEQGELFIAMELLEGESLADRLLRGPVPPAEAGRIALGLLGALEALHTRGLVHRDLKPSNVFLSIHGLKLLDFGLARPIEANVAQHTFAALTLPGTIVGTPHYMAPEQALGELVDARTDLFASGIIVYEMLAGATPFASSSAVEVLQRVIHEQPPPLTGSSMVLAIDRMVRKALTKVPARRYQSAAAMAQALREALETADTGRVVQVRPATRLIVLPFRILRPDPETDFLAFSLSDAITSSLSGLGSLVVRSSAAAAKFSGMPDVKAIAAEAEVDVVLTGTLVRAGDQIRVNAQLTEASGGSLLWSQSSQVTLGDVFQLQDDLTRKIVASLAVPLSARDQRLLRCDVPASATAYEFYLRANQLADETKSWTIARDLYLECLEADPRYAPAWARLGRVYRLMGKYLEEDSRENLLRAEKALQRAIEINPDLPVAHSLYAQLEVDLGRADAAMLRLLDRARTGGADPEIFAGLVYACRCCGLLAASAAAHEEARRLDSQIPTSVAHTYWMRGEHERVADLGLDGIPYIGSLALAALGRTAEALDYLRRIEQAGHKVGPPFIIAARALLEGRRDESLAAAHRIARSNFKDPEALYYIARHLVHLGDGEEGLLLLARSIDGGFFAHPVVARDPWLEPIRADPRLADLLTKAEERHLAARAAFLERDGRRALGLSSDP